MINRHLAAWGLPPLTEGAAARLTRLAELLLEANGRVNLTAVRDMDGVLERHIADSLALYLAAEPRGRVMDLGCGGGFPGLPVKIFDEETRRAVGTITMLDSTAKKLRFVAEAAEKLGMTGVETLPARAEEAGRDPYRRESYDLVVSRAVAEPPVLAELALPFVKVGGELAAMRSAKEADDLGAMRGAVEKLGGRVSDVKRYRLGEREFAVVMVKKISRIPTAYPRNFSQITKKPLA